MKLIEALNWRYATKRMNGKKVPDEQALSAYINETKSCIITKLTKTRAGEINLCYNQI
jgi:hypothetical protein